MSKANLAFDIMLKICYSRRDASRLAIKAKEAKIATLEYQVAALEAERKEDLATIRSLKRQLEACGKPS